MRTPRLLALISAVVALLVLGGCYTDLNKQLDEMQQTIDLGNTLDELSAKTSELLITMDSLRVVVAKQDTAIAALANLAGVRYVR